MYGQVYKMTYKELVRYWGHTILLPHEYSIVVETFGEGSELYSPPNEDLF